jgi:soluble epoxide hydrolase/lipid-phosphate phosphatase
LFLVRTVPYRTVEYGLDILASLANRDIYPVDQYPIGQWDYQAFHAEQKERCAATLDKDPENTIKILYSRLNGSSEGYGKPAFTATIRKDGGWFGLEDKAPYFELDESLLKGHQAIYEKLVETVKKNGSSGPNSYYLNHDVNAVYTETSVNGGVLNMPVLFIEAKWDHICDTALSRLSEPMRKCCTNLTECSIEAGHWVAFEKPKETNAAIARWLATKVQSQWPGYWKTPLVSK